MAKLMLVLLYIARLGAVVFVALQLFWLFVSLVAGSSNSGTGVGGRVAILVIYVIITIALGVWKPDAYLQTMGTIRKILLGIFAVLSLAQVGILAIVILILGGGWTLFSRHEATIIDTKQDIFTGEDKLVQRGSKGKVIQQREDIFGQTQVHVRDKNIFDNL